GLGTPRGFGGGDNGFFCFHFFLLRMTDRPIRFGKGKKPRCRILSIFSKGWIDTQNIFAKARLFPQVNS
ncbi:MAG: hypothetical protein SPI58_02205, partial [Candidatus Enteromonas sp.]|nr:hypothetical protein [Candidatus Enteromonas sp.]